MKHAILIFSLFLFCLAETQAQTRYYLKIGDISGESQRAQNEGEIELNSFSFNVDQMKSAVGAGRARARVNISGLNIMKEMDSATPLMLQALTSGIMFPEAVLRVYSSESNEGSKPYLIITMENIRITSSSVEGNDGERPQEQWILNYDTIELRYSQQKRDGSLDAPIEFKYDLKKGI